MDKIEASTRVAGSQEPISNLLKELSIPEDKEQIARVLEITSSPKGDCDLMRQAESVSGKPIQNTCALNLSSLYQRSRDSVAQVLTPVDGNMLFGTSFKLCDKNDQKCYFVSNAHVVGNSQIAGLASPDRKSVSYQKVLARDSFKDLVLIEAPAHDPRRAVEIGRSPKPGQAVFTIGHPFAYPEPVLAAGKITEPQVAVEKEYPPGSGKIEIRDGLFASSVSVLQGNSGGPEFNEKGEVVGIKVIALNKGGSVNIPISEALDLIERYKAFQRSEAESGIKVPER